MILTASWNIAGTESFRWSSSLSPKGYGCNLQTLPKQLRHLCVAPEGRILVQLDLSQAEARVVAYLARCKGLIELFNDPARNVHHENALRIFNHKVEKDSPEYVHAKGVVYAATYKVGPNKFAQQTGLPRRDARLLLERYHGIYPEIRRWHQEIKEEIIRCGRLTSPLGRSRVFYDALACLSRTGKITDQHLKEAISWKPQATIPDITNAALLEIAATLPNVWWHQQGHDACVVSVPIPDLPNIYPHLIRAMTREIPINGMKLTIPVDGTVGYSWGFMYPFTGKTMTRIEWEMRVAGDLHNKPMRERLLKGIYGVPLSGLYQEA